MSTNMEWTGTTSALPDRELVGDSALYARHTAAMNVVKRGAEDDRELLLWYVVWPTELNGLHKPDPAIGRVAGSARRPTATNGGRSGGSSLTS